ncbi:MAG: demethoxyubiquinone hydroxylase family protein, partial [Gammaproteobacteria bacterium]|nr:demethoxyubiquinone hydroxylase family protein [Gammaproteobacteria bacterium]NIO61838.1 demethoxyubiquinone hydroxylase family protein [Gammaproteobacteria bacterium]
MAYTAWTMSQVRDYTFIDKLVIGLDARLQGRTSPKKREIRQNPANSVENVKLDAKLQRLSAGLMRVNHAGEVCAQALYQGQAVTAENPDIRRILLNA